MLPKHTDEIVEIVQIFVGAMLRLREREEKAFLEQKRLEQFSNISINDTYSEDSRAVERKINVRKRT
jgi:hypothetical protein